MSRFAIASAILGAAVVNAVPLGRSSAGTLPLVTFDGNAATDYQWSVTNDPVMGGQSTSQFVVDKADAVGVWAGDVRIVPFLGAAGFCTANADNVKLPDMSPYVAGGIVLSLKAVGGNLTKFQVQLNSAVRSDPKKGEFQGDFTIAAPAAAATAAGFQTIYVPFAKFVERWRGEPEGGAPSAAQLAKLTEIGIGSDGVAGTFKLEIRSIGVAMAAPAPGPTPGPSPPSPPSPLKSIELVSFRKGAATNFKWSDLNDPVMGGRSKSTFRVDFDSAIGIFNGTVAIVPSLKAPGFCNAEARASFGAKMPAAAATYSAALDGGIVLKLKSAPGQMSSFKAAFGNAEEYNFFSYKADFEVPSDGAVHEILVPYSHFSNKWSSATGEPTTKCSDDKSVCPTKSSLDKIQSVGIWAEGKAGDFHLEVVSIGAYFPGQAPQNAACAATEFCCPDAKACLTPTGVSCAKDAAACSKGEICCPFTKECVTASHPCTPVPTCAATEFCCPDALHCLTPVAPGTMCDPADKGACPSPQVCCPLIKQCVSVGVACDPSAAPAFMQA